MLVSVNDDAAKAAIGPVFRDSPFQFFSSGRRIIIGLVLQGLGHDATVANVMLTVNINFTWKDADARLGALVPTRPQSASPTCPQENAC